MEKFDVLQDIAERTGGDIYLGVVGPVRTGKSTFIKRFMEVLVMPGIADPHERERARDELPQSGAGRTIMTTEPKFIPSEAVEIEVSENISVKIRLVDCVGYAVPGALGFEEEENPRMVSTPWSEEPIPFTEAAEIGTRKVIAEHATIGVMVISDGSITEIPRLSFMEAEERVVSEMRELGKPFVVVLNSSRPRDEDIITMAEELCALHNVAVIPLNVAHMSYEDMQKLLMEMLYEFPVTEVNIDLPRWIEELGTDHWLRCRFEDEVRMGVQEVKRVRDVTMLVERLNIPELVVDVKLTTMLLGTGECSICMTEAPFLFNQVLAEFAGEEIEGDHTIMRIVKNYCASHRQWSKMEAAMEDVQSAGYGIVSPCIDEMYLEEPELIKQGGRFGVKLCASAPSYHIIKTSISTEITPLIGTESQCEELVKYILSEFEDDPQKIWNTNIFGKSLHELVQEGINSKVCHMPENAQMKLQQTLQRIVNDGSGGLVCIII